MTTVILEKTQTIVTQPRIWPELKQPPDGALRAPLVLRKGLKVRMPSGVRPQLTTNPPATAWPRIMEGIEDFGIYRLYIYAPREAFFQTQRDPAIIAEKGGRYYLIAAWD
jgi:hypothetical protein